MLPVTFTRRRVPNGGLFDWPWDPLARMSRMLDLFEGRKATTCGWGFDVDVREDDERFVIEADLPGLEKRDVDITVEDGVVTIEANHGSEEEDKGEGYCIRERRHGQLARSFRLPEEVEADKINAEFKNGVLTVTLPKQESSKPKKIQVKIE